MSYSGYKSSPRGSRGFSFSRGGYRGSSRGDGGSWRGGSGRGYSSSSRGSGRGSRFSSGGGKWERESSNSYDSRSRYVSAADRYSGHVRDDSSSYRYRSADDSISSYSSRDHSHRAVSPDRKRIRVEYSPASSLHRSHDYGEGMEYASRSYGGYEGKRMSSYGAGDERRMFREERDRIRSDDYQFRKPLSIGGPRHSTPRGSSYRGRSFSRGLRSGYRRSEPYRGGGFIRKRVIMGSYGIQRRIATGRTQEYLRRIKLLKMQRLRRLRERAAREEEGEGSGDEDDENEEVVEEEEEVEEEVTDEENEDDGEQKEDEDKVKKEPEDEEMEEGAEEKKNEDEEPKKKTKKVKKIVKVVKKIKRKVPKKKIEEDDNVDGESKELHVTVKQDSEGRDVDAPVRTNSLGEPFIKLECPHCNTNSTTFKEYLLHLYKSKHQNAMGNIILRVKKTLAKMRLEQRNEQRDIDEECKLKKMNMRTFYCMTCKLNYRSLKSDHLRSEKHKEMLNFLNPFCKICRASCRSPMMYENHLCSLNHIKNKFYYEKRMSDKQEGTEVDMDKFMVLDQVGSGEEESESEESEEKEKEENEGGEEGAAEGEEKPPKVKKPKKKKKGINLGSEFCKKLEIYFCELCKAFLPRIEDQEQALAVHCRGSTHLRWYVRKKDDLALRKKAERIHRLREEQKKLLKKQEEEKAEPMDEDAPEGQDQSQEDTKKTKEAENEDVEMEGGEDDKVWTEVNKDIGDLLKEVDDQGNKSSDDEDDTRAAGRRYDRFKHSEKGKAGNIDENESKVKSIEINAKSEIVNGDDDA